MTGLIVWLVLLAVTILVSLIVICAVRRPMRELLEANSYISAARDFYLRAFTVLIFLAAIATICKTDVPGEDKALMEYIWWVVDAAQPVFFALSLWLIGYAAILTVLFVVLGRYRD